MSRYFILISLFVSQLGWCQVGSDSFFCYVDVGGGNGFYSCPAHIEQADVPDTGWYWASPNGGVGGWGVNIEVQQSNISATGNFVFGSFYTYDENNQAIWYTIQGNYQPNEDVYAWREGRGEMGTLTSDIYLSTGGACLVCTPSPATSTGAVSDLGQAVITWHNSYEASISIGGQIVHNVSRF